MSLVITWSPHSLDCVQAIYDFLYEKDPDAAKAAAETILEKAEILETFPSAGRPADDLDPEHRELVIPFGVSGYVLLYHLALNEQLVVLAVRHQLEVGY